VKQHRIVTTVLAATLVALVALGMSSCGDEVEQAGTASSPTAGPAAMVPDYIRSEGILKIGSNFTTPPMEYLPEGSDTPIGCEVDLMNNICEVLELEPKWYNINWDGLRPALQSDRFDCVIAAMGDFTDRQEQVTFVDYIMAGGSLLVLKENASDVTSVEDLAGKRIAVTRGTSEAAGIVEVNEGLEAEGLEPMVVKDFPNDSNALLALRSGRVFGFSTDVTVAAYYAKTAGDGEVFANVLPDLIEGYPYGIAVNKDNMDLAEAIQAALQQMMDDGTYQEILDEWGLEGAAIDEPAINGGTRSSEG